MTFPAVAADADPDPTTQLTWPTARPKRTPPEPQGAEQREVGGAEDTQASEAHSKRAKSSADLGKGRLSTWNLITLSISMAGAQIAWTVELGYDSSTSCDCARD